MPVGLLPALGGGIRALAETGQQSRLLDGYFRPYVRAFGDLYYFSYLPEALDEFTSDPELLKHVHVLAPKRRIWRGRRAEQMTGAHQEQFNECAALRVFQITGVIPALKAKKLFGVPYVTTYGFWYGQLSRSWAKSLLKRVLERRGLKNADAVIATTEELRARAARVARRVELIPNGVDTRLFAPRPVLRPRRRGEPARILYVGRLSPEKNLKAVITATRYLGDAAIDVMVGSGPLADELAVEARAQGVWAEFPGVVDQRQLPGIYGSADVFVLASFTEGHPKVLLEAMSCGLPCVASDCAGNRSLITHEETGLLFDPHRPEDLAACLKRVLSDDALADRLGRAGRALVESRYDLAGLVEREIALVRSVGGARG
jgi:glycosyltransferase involved in cell wall biosynthesis